MDNKRFIEGDLSTGFISEEYPDNNFTLLNDELKGQAALAVAVDKFINERKIITNNKNIDNKISSNWKSTHRKMNLRKFGGSR
jgi:acetyl/propionyl-CoA carboxylase alpha subunit